MNLRSFLIDFFLSRNNYISITKTTNHHYFMKEKNSRWYNERQDYYKEQRPDYSDEKIHNIINAFER